MIIFHLTEKFGIAREYVRLSDNDISLNICNEITRRKRKYFGSKVKLMKITNL